MYYVAGNHEWYRHDYVSYTKELVDAIHNRQSVHGAFLNLEFAFNSVAYEELEDLKLRFIFGPLWADGGPTLQDRAKVARVLHPVEEDDQRRRARAVQQLLQGDHRLGRDLHAGTRPWS